MYVIEWDTKDIDTAIAVHHTFGAYCAYVYSLAM
jgi:hypothetical protein